MFLHMNKNLRLYTNIYPEISDVDIFILNIVKDFLKKKVTMQKNEKKIWRQITGIALPLRLQNIGTYTMPRLW